MLFSDYSRVFSHVCVVISLTALLFSSSIYAQTTPFCGNEFLPLWDNTSGVTTDCFLNASEMEIEKYQPQPDDPVKKFRIKIWVMQFSKDNPLNFPETQESRDYMEAVIDIANSIYRDIRLPHLGSTTPIGYPNDPDGLTHISDARIEFVFDKNTDIEFIADPIGWSNDENWSDQYLGDNYGVGDCTFDMFILGDFPSVTGVGRQHYNLQYSWYRHVQELNPGGTLVGVQFYHAYNVLHEFGHTLGLNHSWEAQFSDIECPHCAGLGASGSCALTCTTAFCDPFEDAFCYSNNMSYASSAKRNFTPLQIGRMQQMTYRASHTRYWEHEYDPSKTITVSGQELWDLARLVEGDVIVEAGAELTISCKVLMPPGSRILVKKGGRLIVDDGHLTISSPVCGQYWDGIMVDGDPTQTQGSSKQGWVHLINESLVEYANTAVHVQGGGVLRMDNSTIKDCRYGVYFRPYEHPILPWFNSTNIANSTFRLTDNHTQDVQPFNSLYGVSGIEFENCTFTDDRTPSTAFPTPVGYFQSRAIRSLNANFTVSGASTFHNLWLGVEAGNSGSVRNFRIQDATFTDCFGGIVNRAVHSATITDNVFTMGLYDVTPVIYDEDTPPIEWDGFGISLQSASGCKIEGNSFTGFLPTGTNLRNTLGVYANDLGGAANFIAHNIYDDVTISNYAEGVNQSAIDERLGLRYNCEQNTGDLIGAAYDFYIKDGSSIALEQGALDEATGNVFRSDGFAPGRNFRNATDQDEVNYYYFNGVPAEYPQVVLNTDRIPTDNQNDCVRTDDGFSTPGEKETFAQAFEQSRAAFNASSGGGNFNAYIYYNDYQLRGQRLLRDAMSKGEEVSEAEIADYLLKLGDNAALYTLAGLYRENGDFVLADQVLSGIDLSTPAALAESSGMMQLRNLEENLQAGARNWLNLQAGEVAAVESLALGGAGMAKAQARQVLNQTYGYQYLKLPAIPGASSTALTLEETGFSDVEEHSSQDESNKAALTSAAVQLSVSPNPASGQVRFDLNWPTQNGSKFAVLRIVDVHGTEVYHTSVLVGQQQLYWHPSAALNGVFFVYLQVADELPQAPQRIVLIH